jgi:hypothetical protein
MYAADHIRRVLRTFPVYRIGEFSIHKEFVLAKIAAAGQPSDLALID